MESPGKSSMEDIDYDLDDALLQKSDDERLPKHPRKRSCQRFILVMVTGIVGGLIASVFWAIFLSTRSCPTAPQKEEHKHTPSEIFHCGSSPAEARALGCKLQTWSYGWVPEPCFDPELNEEFIELHKKDNLPYYLDSNGTQMVDFDTVYDGGIEVLYTVWGSHYWHCAFMMRKFFRRQAALTTGGWDYEHITHCEKWIADPFRFDFMRVNIKAPLFYAKCDPSKFSGFIPGSFEIIE